MADTPTPENFTVKKTPAKPAKGGAAKTDGPAKAASRKTGATSAGPGAAPYEATPVSAPVAEAKSRFNAALEEAKLGAAALRAEAENRFTTASGQAKGKGTDLVAEARSYGDQALGKAGEFAVEGKKVTSDAIASLGKVVGDTAAQIDEKLGEQYGDYARKASRTLAETSAKLESKSVEELGEDAREAVRKSPGVAVGVAAVFGFFLARIFGGRRR
jgi:ElaB/YqjD/DUF883 family membrane-anchored ribosome-binding protein